MREDDATIVFVKDQCVWVPETDCDKVSWSKQPPTRPPNGWPGVRYNVIVYGRYWFSGELVIGNASGIVTAPYTVTSGGFDGAAWVRLTGSAGEVFQDNGYWTVTITRVVATPVDPEPPPTGCLVKVFVEGNQYWWRQFDIPCSEIPIEKQCPNECPPGWHKVILDRNTGKYCCCECPPV